MAKINQIENTKIQSQEISGLMQSIHLKYSSEMQEINNLILSFIESDEKVVREASEHIINSGGKRIRPILTLLCADLFHIEKNSKRHIILAAATEFIHTATLLHDDVVDGSLLRRFSPTVNSIWGNQEAILVGDFLFSASFKLMVAAKSYDALETLAESSRVMAKGEVTQLAIKKSKRFIDEDMYFNIISCKTAELFGAACKVGSIVAEASARDQELIRNYGIYLGLIYQIKDDMMDYYSNSDKIGKNIGDDFYESKITLPLIYLKNKASKEDREYIEFLMLTDAARSQKDLQKIIELLGHYDIKSQLEDTMQKLYIKSGTYLDALTNIAPEIEKYLRDLVYFASARIS
ncbi:MAG: polyprenyl synthetase family protein [Alphaproteobacteria bacterium]|nr:polyprenyl synthetase family protein [Alphaproteobacteria bacterium]